MLSQLGPLAEDFKEETKQTFLAISPDLAKVESCINTCLQSDYVKLSEIASYLFNLGGKRIRPIFSLLSARLFKLHQPTPTLIKACAGIELVHMATLLHDDIIDNAETRRGRPSAFRTYGLPLTLLSGDFLLVKAFGLCSQLDAFIVERTEKACVELTEGEAMEGELDIYNPLELERYWIVVKKKTASMFGLAGAIGAHCAGATDEEINILNDFGYACGVAFQIVDDILDITADKNILGKVNGTDLKQKVPSIVNILWLKSADPTAYEFFSKESISDNELIDVVSYLRTSSVIEECKNIAAQSAQTALSLLETLKPSRIDIATASQLKSLVNYTLHRCL